MEQVAQEIADQANLYGMDVDQAPETPSQLGIMSIPALVFFKGGKEAGRMIGVVPKAKILDKLKSLS
jgi:thioredoxin 1